jgi:MFS family permease
MAVVKKAQRSAVATGVRSHLSILYIPPGAGNLSMYQITNIYALAAFGTIGGSLFGFDRSSMSAWLATDQYTEYFNNPASDLQGGITASMSGGSFLGALGAGFLADRFGRKVANQIAFAVFIAGCVIVSSLPECGPTHRWQDRERIGNRSFLLFPKPRYSKSAPTGVNNIAYPIDSTPFVRGERGVCLCPRSTVVSSLVRCVGIGMYSTTIISLSYLISKILNIVGTILCD